MNSKLNWLRFFPRRTRNRLSQEISHFLPESIRRVVKRSRCERRRTRFYEQISGMTDAPLLDIDEGPAQPRELTSATSAMTEKSLAKAADPDSYFSGTYNTMYHFLRELEEIGFDFKAHRSVLDFGCGSGRFIRTLRCVPNIALVGTDINPNCIDWCRKNIEGVEFHLNTNQPSLDFIEDNSLDLVISFSVFTHIPLRIQMSWLQELSGKMRPGGIFLCTVLGDFHFFKLLNVSQQEQLHRTGHYTLTPTDKAISLSSKITQQEDVFQTHDEIVRVFGAYFEVLKHRRMQPQDLLVLRKPLS